MIILVEKLVKDYKSKITTRSLKDIFFPTYRIHRAVNDISFSITKGESVALLGPNGAGKTTLMKMLTGLMYPTSGKIAVLGHAPFNREKSFLKRIGLVMGNKTGLDWDLTSEQSFQLTKKIYGIHDHIYLERLRNLTELLDVTKFLDVQVRKLSLGERMKMELIGAILHNPEILFLDEPTIGLDIISKQKIREFLRVVQKESGVTLLLTSHDMDDVEKVSDRVIVITNGKKVYDNTLTHLMQKHTKDRYVKFMFKNKPERKKVEDLGSIFDESENSYTFKITASKMPILLTAMAKKFDILDIDILSIPLDEIIADIYTA